MRYYNPELGRWISRDPVWEKSGINLYVFVYNYSIRFIDPDGCEAMSSDGIDADSVLKDQSPSYSSCVKWRYIFSYVR